MGSDQGKGPWLAAAWGWGQALPIMFETQCSGGGGMMDEEDESPSLTPAPTDGSAVDKKGSEPTSYKEKHLSSSQVSMSQGWI